MRTGSRKASAPLNRSSRRAPRDLSASATFRPPPTCASCPRSPTPCAPRCRSTPPRASARSTTPASPCPPSTSPSPPASPTPSKNGWNHLGLPGQYGLKPAPMHMPPENPQPELVLLSRMRQGDETAFVAPYRRDSPAGLPLPPLLFGT